MRRTTGAVAVAKALLLDPSGQHYGWELSRTAKVRSATMYRVLARMLDVGWLSDGWEHHVDVGGRPPRRYYRLTDQGLQEMPAFVEETR